ncbi:unnamed protein product [Ixodes hexagonus]
MTARIVDGVVYSPFPDFDVQNYSAPRLIRERLTKFGDKIVAIDYDQQLTGNQLLTKILRYATGFQRGGLGPGSHVCAHLSNTLENVAALLGVVFVGGTVVMAKPTLVTRELLYQIKDSECRFVLTDKLGASKMLEVEKDHRLEELFCIGNLPGFTDIIHFQELSESSFEEYTPCNNAEDVIAVLYTSGSTGPPKGVEASHKAYVAGFHSLNSLKQMTEDDVLLAWSPITHVSGFTLNVSSMCLGVWTIFRDPSLPVQEFLKDVEAFKVSVLFRVPTKMQAILNHVKATGARVPRVTKMFLAGSMLQGSLGQDLCDMFGTETLACIYALSEAFGIVSATPLGQVTTDNVGLPVAGFKVKVTALIPTVKNVETSWCVHWRRFESNFDAKNSPSSGGHLMGNLIAVLLPGDLGYHDDAGRLYVVDRLKQMIKCMDNQLAPAELEEILLSHDAVKEVAVVGLPSPKYGEAPAACVVLRDAYKEKHEAVEEELKELIAGRTAVYKHLYGGVIFMDFLPKSDSGKILRQELKSKAAAIRAA